jgi:APA family basic amino acid/polyamine antiporter
VTLAVTESGIGQKNKLLRILGLGFGLAVAIGGMIGVGILRTPGTVASHLGDARLIITVWVLGGLYALLGANSFAELGTMLPRAGGPYAYARRAYGDYGGFLIGWSDWLVNMGATAYMAVVLAEYSAALIPRLSELGSVAAVIILLILAVLNWAGLRIGSGIQQLTTLFKVLAFLAVIAACFIFGAKGPGGEAQQTLSLLAANPTSASIAVLMAFQFVIETYAGWYSPVYFGEEDTNPARNLPRSLFGGVLSVTAIYVFFNLAMLYVLTIGELAASKLAAADAAQIVFGGLSAQIITALALVSIVSILNALLLQTPRIIFALGRDGLLSPKAAAVNAGGTPSVALALTVLIAMILAASGTFETLFALTAFLGLTIDASAYAALLVLRKREPTLPRPFKAWGYPLIPVLVLIGTVLLFLGYAVNNKINSMFALAMVALSYPAYLIVKRVVKPSSTPTNSLEPSP